jgi:ribosomal protein S18 acetylase RimI-like enzyme
MTDTTQVQRVVVRPLREGELEALEWEGIYTKYRRIYSQTYNDVLRGQRLMLVAAAEAVLVGQIFIQLSSSESNYADGYSRAYLYSLRVRPEWQGQGLGTRLIRAAEDALRARGFTLAVIAAGKDNPGARRLYERLGYQAFAEDPGVWYFVDPSGKRQSVEEPCWLLEKRLNSTLEES